MLEKIGNKTDEFFTPPELVKAMGEFDLDPCASHFQPEPLAIRSYILPLVDGLMMPWAGSVFVNPPFSELSKWTERFIVHGDGVLLVPARIETRWFERIWAYADAIFFTYRSVKYLSRDDRKAPGFFGGAFCAIGQKNVQRLHKIPLKGALVTEWEADGRAVGGFTR